MINYIHMIVIFWSGILIAWSACAAISLSKIMYNVHKSGHDIRRTDVSNLVVIGFTGIVQLTLMFIFPDWMANLVDTVLIANTWYTLYISFITYSNISAWPNSCKGRIIRRYPTPNNTIKSVVLHE
jgi:amino acid transporter